MKTISKKIRSSTIVRTLMKPMADIRDKRELIKYSKTEDSEFVRSFKNKHLGQRCFIIGNGPSLTGKDLDLIKGEISFACNRIYNIFGSTEWRPTYYMCVDRQCLYEEINNIKKLKGCIKFVSTRASIYGRNDNDEIHYVEIYAPFIPNVSQKMISEISIDPSVYLSNSHSVVIDQIELAIYMGFKEIYLIGVDHNYPIMIDKNGKTSIDKNIKSHFENGGSKDANLHYIYYDAATHDYQICEDFARENGIDIYNITRGGKLEVFRRKKLEEVVC